MTRTLDPSDPALISVLPALLSENTDGVLLENFLGKSWNVFYDLYNPENFEDPENSPEWYDSTECYKIYDNGFRDPSSITILGTATDTNLSVLQELISNASKFERDILDYFINYTFGGGGAYAASEHFEYARRTFELLHKQSITQQEFIERNLCFYAILLDENSEVLDLLFHCGWDFEHGVGIKVRHAGLAT